MRLADIWLTAPSGISFALSNQFSDVTVMRSEIKKARNVDEVCSIINEHSYSGRTWLKYSVTDDELMFASKDLLGNIWYVVIRLKEEPKVSCKYDKHKIEKMLEWYDNTPDCDNVIIARQKGVMLYNLLKELCE